MRTEAPSRTAALCLLLPVLLPAQEAAPVPDLAARLRGAWSAAESGQVFWFDGARCVVAYGLQQTLMSVTYRVDGAGIERRLLAQDMPPIVSGIEFEGDDELRLVGSGRTLTLTRIAGAADEPPEAVRTKPMEFGERQPDAEEIARIAAELVAGRDREQAVRAELQATQERLLARYAEEGIQASPWQDPELQPVVARMHGIDRENSRRLKDLLADIGWIDAARFGAAANESAFLIVQHCGNLAMLRSVVAALQAEFAAGHAAAGPRYALMHDRLMLERGGQQRYGSQLHPRADGSLHFPRLEDPAGVDERRAAVGLESLDDYAERMGGDAVERPAGYAPGCG